MSRLPQDPERLLRRLEWTVLRRLDGLLHGDYRTLVRGQGLDLADLREYQYYDDVRRIDWNVTARMQVPWVREYHEEREVTAWFLLDLSPSVDLGTQGRGKRAVATELVAVLARLLTRHGNRVGAMFYGDRIETVIPAKSGRRQVLHMLHRMAAKPAMERSNATNLGEFLGAAAQIMRRRSLVFLVSDFVTGPGWTKPLAHIAQRHEIVAVRLVEPDEGILPELGMLMVQDAETGEQVFVDTRDKGFRKRFLAASARRENEIRSSLQSAGVDTMELSTAEPLVDAVMRFADLRKRRRQTAGATAARAANAGARA
jgi:uncharacterized protein (DUF58 family)